MKSKPEGIVNYLRFVDFTLDAVKQNEELQDRLPHQQEKGLFRPTYTYVLKKPPKITNSTSTDATFRGAW